MVVSGEDGLYLGSGGVELAAGTHIDTTSGPVVLDSGVQVMPHCYLEGPLYVGRGTSLKSGARIYGESSFGIGCRLAGEIGESTFGDFSNKQHDGFIVVEEARMQFDGATGRIRSERAVWQTWLCTPSSRWG